MSYDDSYIGEIQWISFNYPPKGWAFCNGQLLPINQNQALFSLLGTTYGGDGRVNFALPDLRGRVATSMTTVDQLGQAAGTESVTLTAAQMPVHTHSYSVTDHRGTTGDPGAPAGAVFASGPRAYAAPNSANTSLANVTSVGGSQPHPNLQPYLSLSAIICLQGIFPSQN